MGDKPLEPPLRDPTAMQAIRHIEGRDMPTQGQRVRYPSAASTMTIAPPATLEDVRARRKVLGAQVHAIDDELRVCMFSQKRGLVERKMAIERTLAHLKGVEAEFVKTAPPPQMTRTQREISARMAGSEETEVLYRLYRMFHVYTRDKEREDFSETHRAFLGTVSSMLRKAGYSTKMAHEGDPLEGFTNETEAA